MSEIALSFVPAQPKQRIEILSGQILAVNIDVGWEQNREMKQFDTPNGKNKFSALFLVLFCFTALNQS